MADTKPAKEGTSKLNLYQKLAAITGEVGAIEKGGHNAEQKFDYIEAAAVGGKFRPLFAKYNVLIVPYMQKASKQQRTEVTTKYGSKGEHVLIDFTFVVYNADDPSEKFSVSWTGESIDYGDKATNKAATAALKGYMKAQFNISEKGDDPDATSPDQGKVEGTKATTPIKPSIGTAAPAEEPTVDANGNKLMNPTQKTTLFSLLKKRGVHEDNMATVLTMKYGVKDPKVMTAEEASRVIGEVMKTKAEA